MKKIDQINLECCSAKIDIFTLSREIENNLHARYNDKTLCNQYSWWMLESVTKKSKTELIALGELDFTNQQLDTIANWVKKQVIDKEPLQYLLGSVPFCDLEIFVEPPILIPRPETEEICHYAIDMLQKLDNKNLTILDIGTGSGCIALTLAKALPESLIYAVDISDQALKLGSKNAKHNNINNIKFINSNVYVSIPENLKFDLIISNPPYITQEEFCELDESVSLWEDKRALVADQDGLAIIKQIITKAPEYLKTNNLKINNLETNSGINSELKTEKMPQLIIEIGYKQGVSVSKLFKLAGFVDIVVKKDLEGKDRFVTGRVKLKI